MYNYSVYYLTVEAKCIKWSKRLQDYSKTLTQGTQTLSKSFSRNIFATPSLLKTQLETEYKSFQYSAVKHRTSTNDSPQVQI